MAVAATVLAGCGGGPGASVGVTPVVGGVEVRAKACGAAGLERVDLVEAGRPGEALWSARRDGGPPVRRLRLGGIVAGYRTDGDLADPLPAGALRVRAEGSDGASWGGPRFEAATLEPGTIRVAGQDVDLAEWEAEPARCPRVGLGGALLAGGATAAAAGLLWLVVRGGARLVRRRPEDPGGEGDRS